MGFGLRVKCKIMLFSVHKHPNLLGGVKPGVHYPILQKYLPATSRVYQSVVYLAALHNMPQQIFPAVLL